MVNEVLVPGLESMFSSEIILPARTLMPVAPAKSIFVLSNYLSLYQLEAYVLIKSVHDFLGLASRFPFKVGFLWLCFLFCNLCLSQLKSIFDAWFSVSLQTGVYNE